MTNRLTVHPTDPTVPIADLVEDYLDSCRARGLSKNTIDQAYGYSLRDVFLPWCAEHGVTAIDHLNQRDLDRFTSSLLRGDGARKPRSPSTVHSYVRPVRQMLLWAERQGEGKAAGLPQLPRLPRKVLDVLSRDEIKALEAAAGSERDRLIIRVLADTGARVSELCQLRPGDVSRHRGGGLLLLNGKGDKQRLVPISPAVTRRLEQFMRRRDPDAPDRVFFAKRPDRDGLIRPLTRSGVLQMFVNAADRAQLRKRVYPHLLRHSFATEALRRGVGGMQLANVLGHSGLRMIEQTYSHLNVDDAYDVVLRVVTDA